jgi:hypothetical protein
MMFLFFPKQVIYNMARAMRRGIEKANLADAV